MRCIAHRGFAGEFAENTVDAVASAAEVADWVEVDVRRCGSDDVVVVHDATVDRVTDATGEVSAFSRTELADLNVLGSGQGIPALSDVVEVLPPSVGINVELKEHGLATDVVDVLGAHDGGVLISSFDAGVLAEVTVLADYPRALLVEADPDERLSRAADLDCTAIHPHWDICDERFVSRAHDANLTVNAWTIEDTVGAVSARNAGVDGLIADRPRFCEG